MNERQILINAKKLIAKPESWMQGRYGIPAPAPAHGPEFSKLDAFGALCEAGKGQYGGFTERAWRYLGDAIDGKCPIAYNDEHTHVEVLAAFDRAVVKFDEKAAKDAAKAAAKGEKA